MSDTAPGMASPLDAESGRLDVFGFQPPWNLFVPLADGHPFLKGCTLLEAECRGNVLAVKVLRRDGGVRLRLFQGPHGVPLAEYNVAHQQHTFALSADGARLALQVSGWGVEVRDIAGRVVAIVASRANNGSFQIEFLLGEDWLVLRKGRSNVHLLRWHRGTLELRQWFSNGQCRSDTPILEDAETMTFLRNALGRPPHKGAAGKAAAVPSSVQYDRERFVMAARFGLSVILDRYGQLAVFDRQEKLICMFFVFRDQLSGWLPDGTCFGPSTAANRPPTPGDLEKFGKALAAAPSEVTP